MITLGLDTAIVIGVGVGLSLLWRQRAKRRLGTGTSAGAVWNGGRAADTGGHVPAGRTTADEPAGDRDTVGDERAGFRVRIGSLPGDVSGQSIVVSGLTRTIPPRLALASPEIFRSMAREATRVGDPDFDRVARVAGERATIFALLDGEARGVFRDALARNPSLYVLDGELTLYLSSTDLSRRPSGAWVNEAVRLAGHLALPKGGLVKALARNVRSDPFPAVRRRAYEALVASFPDAPEAQAVARERLGDKNPGVRLVAAAILGTEALDTLAAIVREPLGEFTAEAGVTGNLWWEFEPPPAPIGEITDEEEQARAANEAIRSRALELLVERSPAAAVLPLIREAARTIDGPLRLAALRAIARVGDAACEEETLAALEAADEQVRLAAVEALGAVGGAAAVPALRALVSNSAAFDFSLRKAVDAAIAKIQARLTDAAAGQVALAKEGRTSAAGRVSLAAAGTEEIPGRVNLAPPKAN